MAAAPAEHASSASSAVRIPLTATGSGLAVDGAAGAERVLELLRAETTLALSLLGCRAPADVTRAHVRPSPLLPSTDATLGA